MMMNRRRPTALAISCIWTASAARSSTFWHNRRVNLIRKVAGTGN
jgi:hypothetical protein